MEPEANNIMTIDLEEWYHANYRDDFFGESGKYEIRIIENTERILDLFKKYRIKATFFVLGIEAEKFPGLIKKLSDRGHDIAIHGYTHDVLYDTSPEEFADNILKAKKLVEDITRKEVVGYRAPSWSINGKNLYLLKKLEALGFLYDASVFPVKNMLYGMPKAGRFLHKPVVGEQELNLYEIPMSTIRLLGINFPFSGGFYFRVIPLFLIKLGIRLLNSKGLPVIFYLHPREVDKKHPRMKMRYHEKLIHYTGVKRCIRKYEKLLKKYTFTSIADYYKNELNEIKSARFGVLSEK